MFCCTLRVLLGSEFHIALGGNTKCSVPQCSLSSLSWKLTEKPKYGYCFCLESYLYVAWRSGFRCWSKICPVTQHDCNDKRRFHGERCFITGNNRQNLWEHKTVLWCLLQFQCLQWACVKQGEYRNSRESAFTKAAVKSSHESWRAILARSSVA